MSSCAQHYTSDELNSSSTPTSFTEPKRLLLLDGEKGSIACRVYGDLLSGTIPRKSSHGNLESATRSLLRMKNLTAVRGVPGASMIGPIDYIGNLEEPHHYFYYIQEGAPFVFYRVSPNQVEPQMALKEFDNSLVTVIHANWVSGKDKENIKEKKIAYNVDKSHLKQSLFLKPGLLEVDRETIQLNYFDPIEMDLSTFKARLVANKTPFQITKRPLAPKDDYRLITYLYEPKYAQWQVLNGSGLFLEKHRFSQTITPLTPHSKGFVALARLNAHLEQLEVIGIQIPYGYTLIIEEGCIHGDTTLEGYFLMGMTSDHTTMRTADTVFLKSEKTKKNVEMVLVGLKDQSSLDSDHFSDITPLVLYKDPTEAEKEKFRALTKGCNFIFNPFSSAYWQK